jgi:hypothetical protein
MNEFNRNSKTAYILAWESDLDGITERLDAMTDTELTEYFEEIYNEFQGVIPPPDYSDFDPLDNYHLTF